MYYLWNFVSWIYLYIMVNKNKILAIYPNAYCVKNNISKNYVVYDSPDSKDHKRKALGTGNTVSIAFTNAVTKLGL